MYHDERLQRINKTTTYFNDYENTFADVIVKASGYPRAQIVRDFFIAHAMEVFGITPEMSREEMMQVILERAASEDLAVSTDPCTEHLA